MSSGLEGSPPAENEYESPTQDEIEAEAAAEQSASLALIAREMEQALLDLQGPLDTLKLLVEMLDLQEAIAIGWLVRTANASATRLRVQWEHLHEAACMDALSPS